MRHGLAFVLAGALLALAQQQSGGEKKQAPPPEKKPAPLFGGQLGIKSSEKSKESATLAFNGIDPSGKVDAKMMAAAPGAAEQEKVKQLDAAKPTDGDLAAFLAEGGLKKK